MKLKLLIITSYFLTIGCSRKNQQQEIPIPPRIVANDSSEAKQFISILRENDEFENVNLTNNNLKTIEEILNKAVNDYNKSINKNYNKEHINLRNYKRQYIANKLSNGKTIVWINCFCQNDDNVDWQTKILIVRDGGNCFFNLKIDLTEEKYFEFIVNGLA